MGLSDASSRPVMVGGGVLALGLQLTLILSMLLQETQPCPPPNYTNLFPYLQAFPCANTFTRNALSISELLHTYKAPAPMPSPPNSLLSHGLEGLVACVSASWALVFLREARKGELCGSVRMRDFK